MDYQKTALVTGATGMLGTALIANLLDQQFRVKAIYRSQSRIEQFNSNLKFYTQASADGVEWIEADLLDYPSILDAVEGIDIVFHVGAMVSFNSADKRLLYENNVHGTAHVVNACLEKGVKQLCHVSSVAALGSAEEGKAVNETTNWIPEQHHSGYSISKFHSEMEVWRGIQEGLDAVIVNPSVILGAGEWSSGSPAFFSTVAGGLKFYPMGQTGFVDVRDVATVMVSLVDEKHWKQVKGQRYLLNAENRTYREFFNFIARELNVKEPFYPVRELMISLVWRAAWLVSKISGKKPLVTRENLESSAKTTKYDGTKITKAIKFQYRSLEETIIFVAQAFQRSH